MKTFESGLVSGLTNPGTVEAFDSFKAASARVPARGRDSAGGVSAPGAEAFFQADASKRGSSARDFSNPVYIPERNTWDVATTTKSNVAPSEFLQALPFVKGSPLTVITATSALGTSLNVVIQKDAVWENDAEATVYLPTATAILEGPYLPT